MSSRRAYVLPLIAYITLALPACAQSVISTHAGVVHFFEGAVYLGDSRLEAHPGRFPSMPQGGELRTENGRAEVLLTPGVFLRMGESSAIRMVSNDLADTRVELRAGSAIVDSGESSPDTSVTLIYKDWKVHIKTNGVYRIDSDPAHLSVQQGEAEVFAGARKEPVTVERGMSLPFAEVLVPEKQDELASQPSDGLNDWENGRSQSIVADNAITAQIGQDPAALTADADGFTYFPFLDLPYIGSGLYGAYSGYAPYQSGFYSIYLPGVNYRPILLGLTGHGSGIYVPSLPLRTGTTRGYGGITATPRAPYPRPTVPLGPPHTSSGIGGHTGHR